MNGNGTKAHAPESTSRITTDAMAAVAGHERADRERTIPEMVRQAMLEDGLSQKEVASESTIGVAVFNQWLSGKYTGNNEKVNQKAMAWLRARGERVSMAALLPMSPEFFESQTSLKILSHLKFAHMTQDMLTVFGVPGVGKTKAAHHYKAAYPNVWVATMTPATTSVVPVLQEIAESLGLGLSNGARKLAQSILGKVRGSNGLLIIDEAHHMHAAALDALRGLHDAAGLGIAFVGGPELESTIQTMPQFYSRVGLRLFVSRVLTADVDAQLDAWNITRKEARKYLTQLALKPGALRGVNKTLRLASMMAAQAGESLDTTHIKDAAETLATQATGEE